MVSGDEITIEEFRSSLPARQQKAFTDEAFELIKDIGSNLEFPEGEFVKSILSYSGVLMTGRYKTTDYIKAVEYCTYISSGSSIIDAYRKTFPDRALRRLEDGRAEITSNSAATIFHKNALVQKILTQATIPMRLFFLKDKYDAINVLATEMHTAQYSKDRISAADKLLVHLADPMEAKIELDIGVKKDNVIDDYEKAMKMMVEKQREMIEQGADVKSIANAKIVYREVEDAEIVE